MDEPQISSNCARALLWEGDVLSPGDVSAPPPMNSHVSAHPLRPAPLLLSLLTFLTGVAHAGTGSPAENGPDPALPLAAVADPSPVLVGIALLGIGAYFRRRQ